MTAWWNRNWSLVAAALCLAAMFLLVRSCTRDLSRALDAYEQSEQQSE